MERKELGARRGRRNRSEVENEGRMEIKEREREFEQEQQERWGRCEIRGAERGETRRPKEAARTGRRCLDATDSLPSERIRLGKRKRKLDGGLKNDRP